MLLFCEILDIWDSGAKKKKKKNPNHPIWNHWGKRWVCQWNSMEPHELFIQGNVLQTSNRRTESSLCWKGYCASVNSNTGTSHSQLLCQQSGEGIFKCDAQNLETLKEKVNLGKNGECLYSKTHYNQSWKGSDVEWGGEGAVTHVAENTYAVSSTTLFKNGPRFSEQTVHGSETCERCSAHSWEKMQVDEAETQIFGD